MKKPNNNHKKGFASLSLERRQEIAASGGRQAHALGRAHTWTKEEAKLAGQKGGKLGHTTK